MLLSLVLITVYFRESASGGLHSVQSTGASVLRPFEVGADRVAAPFRDSYGWFAGLIHAKSENARLRAQLDALRSEAIQNANAAQQVDEFRAPAQVRRAADASRTTTTTSPPTSCRGRRASSSSRSGSPPARAAGSASTTRSSRPTASSARSAQVAGHSAQVTLLTDANLDVSAIDCRVPGAAGLVSHGEGPDTLTLDRVQKSQVLREGDTVVTQGFKVGPLTSIYPYGIPIGTVSGATNSEVDLYWNAQVAPFVHFDSLHSVLVLVPKKRNQP